MLSYDPNYQGYGVATNNTVTPSVYDIWLSYSPSAFSFYYEYLATTNGTYNFIFVFPFKVTNTLENPENMSITPTKTGTILSSSLSLNGLNQSHFSGQALSAYFEIANTFLSENRGTYTIVLPFGGGDIYDQAFDAIQGNLWVLPNNEIPTDLYVSLPNSYSLTESIPTISDLNPFTNPITNMTVSSLHWNFPDGLQNSVTVMCNDPQTINTLQNMPFWSGIFLGIGVSLIATTCYDSYKRWIEKSTGMRISTVTPETAASEYKRIIPS